jgi:hypothetical protein
MHPTCSYCSQICHQLTKNRRSEEIHEIFHPSEKCFGPMAIRKRYSEVDSTLVEAQRSLRPSSRFQRLLHHHSTQPRRQKQNF